jgi:hypothetical protein
MQVCRKAAGCRIWQNHSRHNPIAGLLMGFEVSTNQPRVANEIVVQKQHKFTASFVQARVSRSSETPIGLFDDLECTGWLRDPPQKLHGLVRGAVYYDNYLVIGRCEILNQYGRQHSFQQVASLVGRYYY